MDLLKNAKKLAKKKIKVRRNWGSINPVTKIKESKKIYKRKKLSPLEIHKLYGI